MKNTLKVIAAIAAMLSFCAAAAAQTTNTIVTQSVPVLPSSQMPPPPASSLTPTAMRRTQMCGGVFYPPIAIRLNMEGTVVLGFTVTPQGTVTDVKVVSSSGHDALDQAAVACAAQWQYKPAMQNGQPVAVSWKATVKYALADSGPVLATPPTCPASIFAAAGSLAGGSLATSLFYHIKADGSVRDVVVGRSSGNDDRDQLAVNCVSQWRYTPRANSASTEDILLEKTVFIGAGAGPRIPSASDISVPTELGVRNACRKPSSIGDMPSADTVVVADIMPDASVADVRLWQSSGSKSLDDFAVACVPKLVFTRALYRGVPARVTIPVRIVW